jgi:hypothetical protein
MIALLEQLNTAAQGAIQEQVDETRTIQEEYLARMTAVNESLLHFQAGVDVLPIYVDELVDPMARLTEKTVEAAAGISELAAAAAAATEAVRGMTAGTVSVAPLVRLIRSVYAS